LNVEPPVLAEVAVGNHDAIATCLQRYSGLVWSLAVRNCPDTETAEDAVQDIFVHLWQVAGKFDARIASESTFVAMVARRRLIDLYRKRKSNEAVSASEQQLDAVADEQQTAAKTAEINDEARKAERFLAELPQEQQHVIRLSIYDGLSHSRIAESTGLSLGTVKTHIRRGLIDLRNRLFPTTQAPDGGLHD
jgi:RNA polymerase sigma-70 factor (ECF subfamily)